MFNKDDIMKIEYTKKTGKIYEEDKIALYNKKRTSKEEVLQAINNDGVLQYDKIILITKEQYENVFY